YRHSVEDAAAGRPDARFEPVGWPGSPGSPGSVVSAVPRTRSSESWAAGQPVFAVTCTRTYRPDVSGTSTVTVLPDAGSNVYAWLAVRVVKLAPSVLACTLSVWCRASHPAGSVSTTSSTAAGEPRSTCAHCGNVEFVDSQ